MEAYFAGLDRGVKRAYQVAEAARSVGVDPETRVEIPPASDMASRVEKLLSHWHVEGIADRIRELSAKESRREMVAFMVAEELAMDTSRGNRVKRLDVAVRTGLAILTEGILVAPLEGLVEAKVKDDPQGPYVDLYYAGPIRAAGGTAQALSVLMADAVRRKLDLAPFVPTVEEIGRYKEEIPLYKHLQHLQYVPTPEEITTAVRNVPVCINGEATEGDEEVTAFRNLKRVGTAGVRGGACLVIAEGICQKAPKLMDVVARLGLDGWGFLKELGRRGAKSDEGPVPKYLSESVGGRPILSHPHRPGGFRLVYGRSRTSGLAATSINPATMTILEDFIAIGTQLKLEYPGKAAAITTCDTIEGPLVLLENGDFVAVNDQEAAKALAPKVKRILDLGEMLVSFGEFIENNYQLVPGAYSLPWHLEEVRAKGLSLGRRAIHPTWEEALEDSRVHLIPLHPRFNLFWHDLEPAKLHALAAKVASEGCFCGGTLELPPDPALKEVALTLGLLHSMRGEKMVVESTLALPFLLGLGLEVKGDGRIVNVVEVRPEATDVLSEIGRVSGIRMKARAPSRIGARVGRPEKARERMMKPPVHVLFPVELTGGSQRALDNVANSGEEAEAHVELGVRRCPACSKETVFSLCGCGSHTEPEEREMEVALPVGQMFQGACKRLGIREPPRVKGVKGLISRQKTPEPIEKGILRARNRVFVYQDGTSRFDMTDIPLTHFRPQEVGLTVERAKELGYAKDWNGEPLVEAGQVLELKPQDLVVSRSCGEYLLSLSRFLDEELERIYGGKSFYGAKSTSDLIGELVITLAPHTSGGVLGRIIGYTEVEGCFAHPAFHASKRRNCDGDEDSVTLLMDGLLNFSFAYIPQSRGGLMDKPLVLTTRLDLREVDKEAQNVDIMGAYPLEFYDATERFLPAKSVAGRMETAGKYLNDPGAQFSGYRFTHDTTDISLGPHMSAYREAEGMEKVVSETFSMVAKIRAVDIGDAISMVLSHHFLPDIMGNMKSYATQKFRCKKCGGSYRRPPLQSTCTLPQGETPCGGELLPTVYEGSVMKYLSLSKDLASQDGVGDYVKQRIRILEDSLATLFPQTQRSLGSFDSDEKKNKI